jgi:hypothetical protein
VSQAKLEEVMASFEETRKVHLQKVSALDAELAGHLLRNKELHLRADLISQVQRRIAGELKDEISSELET